ncbi:MAG: glycosyltransferase [Eubacteriaceae bacterium]|nr:glycosyltransferase [Eubacteriaceae bacterium]
MMIKDLVSVLIPCYNHEKYILNALESVMNNDYELKEIILIDDGSNDSSFEKAADFLAAHQASLYGYQCLKQENHGVTKTLNKMIGLAQGEYVTLLASDDNMTENSISSRVEYLKKNPHKKAVIGKAFIVDEENRITSANASKKLFRANTKLLLSDRISKELTLRWSVVGPTLLLKKEVYQEVGLYNEKLRVEDRDFYLRMLRKNLLGYVDVPVAYYRVHSGNTSRTKTMAQRADLLKEICGVNIQNSAFDFSWDEKLFLSSYRMDKALINRKAFRLLFAWKAARAVLIDLYLLLVSKGIKNERNS